MYRIDQIVNLVIEATSYCNARCPQCDRFDQFNNCIVPLNHLSIDTLKENLELEKFKSLRNVRFVGNCGDVLNHYDPIGLADFFSTVPELQFTTNGSVRNKNYFKELANRKNLFIVFSIDGLSDTNHMYRQGTNFEKIIENARSFIDAGGVAKWKFIVFKHNEHQIEEAKELSKKLGFTEFMIHYTDRSWFNGNIWPVYDKGEYKFDLKPATIIKENALKSDNKFVSSNIKNWFFEAKQSGGITCPNTNHELFIEYQGFVLPCCMLSIDFWRDTYNTKFLNKILDDKKSINLYFNKLTDIFESKFYQERLLESFSKHPMPTCLKCFKFKLTMD